MRTGLSGKSIAVVLWVCAALAGTAPGRILYVDAGAGGAGTGSSWVDAYPCLQDALAAAAAGEKPVEIRVGQGVYKPDQGAGVTPRDRAAAFVLLNGVTLNGGYAGLRGPDPDARDITLYETLLSGDLAGDGTGASTRADNSGNIIVASGTDNTAVIDGFTIAGGCGYTISSSGGQPRIGGTGVFIDAGSPTILNCCFRDHFARGVEVLAARNRSSPIVTGCSFLNNDGIGMTTMNNSNAVVTDCRFEGNTMEAMKHQASNPVITRCSFRGDKATVIQFSSCDAVMTDCVCTGSGNRWGMEGIHCIRGRLALTGCTLTGFKNTAMEAPDDMTLVGCTFMDNAGFMAGAIRGLGNRRVTAYDCVFANNEGTLAGAMSDVDVELYNCVFTGNSGRQAGAIQGDYEKFIAVGCVFCGNSSSGGAGAVTVQAQTARLSNCTFTGNRGPSGTLECMPSAFRPIRLAQCILRDGSTPFSLHGEKIATDVTYCNIEGGWPGEGNIDVDPCFVDPGRWDPNGTPDDPNDDIWIAGDYHLKSQGGHWDRATQAWIRDDVTSVCIDAGDPNALVGAEPFPNGGFVNMGAYGGTAEASKSYFGEPVCETQIAGDINGDCVVNQADLDILLLHWLMDGTTFVDTPPTITLLSPKDGDELTSPTPIIFRAAASDPGGAVVGVTYTVQYSTGTSTSSTGTGTSDPANDWQVQWSWSRIHHDGPHTIWVEATDNEGLKTVTPKITVTFHP